MLIGAAAVAAGLSTSVPPQPSSARPAGEGPWAVELFTSQGCSSCPPADAYLGRLSMRPDIVATPELSRALGSPLTIKLAAFPLEGRVADVTLAIYDRRHTTPVKSGENQGRMIENFNIVRQVELIDRWNGAAKTWTIAGDRIGPTQGVAVLVQQTDHGPMIGCNKLEPAYSG